MTIITIIDFIDFNLLTIIKPAIKYLIVRAAIMYFMFIIKLVVNADEAIIIIITEIVVIIIA